MKTYNNMKEKMPSFVQKLLNAVYHKLSTRNEL